jgi:hypothetical protein
LRGETNLTSTAAPPRPPTPQLGLRRFRRPPMRSQGAHAPNPHAPARHRVARHQPPSPTESSNHQGSLPRDPSRIAPYRPGQHPASRSTQPTASVTSDPATGQRHQRPGEQPASSATRRTASVSWLVNACRAQPTHNRLIQPSQFLDSAPPQAITRVDFNPRICWPRFHHVAHATRSPGSRSDRNSLETFFRRT